MVQSAPIVLVWSKAPEGAQLFGLLKLHDAILKADIKIFCSHIKIFKTENNIAKVIYLRQIQEGKLYLISPKNLSIKSIVRL